MACWNDRWVPEPWARPLALTPKRRQHITARLRRFSVEELCEAIRVMRLSPHHCGRNDRHWIAPPEFLLRSDEQVERFLAMPTGDAASARDETPGYRRLDSDEARREVGLL